MAKQTLGEFLSLLRKANGYTQQDVADTLNISNRTLSSWETDRTVPDILMLPALADLYGVTVDELLRGEKLQPEKTVQTDFSDKAQREIRKNRFGKFSSKFTLLCGINGVCAGLMFLAETLISLILWLSVLLFVLGAIGIVICTALTFFFANGTKAAEGIVFNEDLTEENKAFVLALRNKSAKILAFNAWAFSVFFTLYLLLSALVYECTFMSLTLYIGIVNAVIGLAFLIAYAVYFNSGIKVLASGKQTEKYAKNKKLVKRLCIWGTIPIALCWSLYVAFLPINLSFNNYIYKESDFEKFKNHMQTLIVTQDSYMHLESGVPVGEYVLNFTEKPTDEEGCDLGNGFTGYYYHSRDGYGIQIFYNNLRIADCLTYSVCVNDANVDIINVRYAGNSDLILYNYGFGIKARETYYAGFVEKENFYAYYSHHIVYMQPFFYGFAVFATVIALAVCTVIYFTKRKRQTYSF